MTTGVTYLVTVAAHWLFVATIRNAQSSEVTSLKAIWQGNIIVPPDSKLPGKCSSCKNSCGHATALRESNWKTCSCDRLCKMYGDCCEDFQSSCKDKHRAAIDLQNILGTSEATCLRIGRGMFSMFVSSCNADPIACKLNTSQLNNYIPVTDDKNGIHYRNLKCGKCNGLVSARSWDIRLACKNNTLLPAIRQKKIKTLPRQLEYKLLSFIESAICRVDLIPPKHVSIRDCRVVKSRCSRGCSDQTIVKKCSQYQNYVGAPARPYFKNKHCAICNGKPVDKLTCGFPNKLHRPPGKNSDVSFSVLLDFNPSSGIRIVERDVKCVKGGVARGDACVVARCRPGFSKVGKTCVAFSDSEVNTTFSVTVFPESGRPQSTLREVSDKIVNVVKLKVRRTLREYIGRALFRNIGVYMKLWSNDPVEYHMFVTFRHVVNITMTVIDNINEEIKRLQGHSAVVLGIRIKITVLNVSVTDLVNSTDCVRVHYKRNEFKILQNKSLLLLASKKQILPKNYILRPIFAFVCVDWNNTSKFIKGEGPNFFSRMGIVTVVCTSFSLIALSIRLGLQCVVPAYKRFAGKLQFFLCFTLHIATAAFLVGPLIAAFRVPCYIAAVLVHWGFLSAFLWMSTIAFHTWWLFRPSKYFRKHDDVQHSVARPCLVAFGIPIILVALCIGLDQSTLPLWIKPGYGIEICWITNRYALIGAFVIPVGICIVCNITLFVLTSTVLYKALASTAEITGQEHRRTFVIYVRLLVMMGTTWVFGFIAAGTAQEFLWYIFIVLNSSQGIFIFAAFVCTKQVRLVIMEKSKRRKTFFGKNLASPWAFSKRKSNAGTTTSMLASNSNAGADSVNVGDDTTNL